MQSVIEQLEAREYLSTSLSGAKYLAIQPSEAVVIEQVNNGDREDLYMIRVNKPGQVNLRLEGLTGDACLEFISDRNHNGRLDSGEVTMRSNKLMAANENIRRQVTAGIYYVRVTQVEWNSIVNYTLRYSTKAFTTPDKVDQAGDTTATARDLSIPLGSNRTVNDYLTTGDLDVYRLEVTETAKYDIRLSGFTKDANITLTDAAGNALASTLGKAKSAKLISGKLSAGTYYVTVNATGAQTGYALRVVASAPRTSDADLTQARVPKFAANPLFSTKLIESK
jgi:hypothetical protein